MYPEKMRIRPTQVSVCYPKMEVLRSAWHGVQMESGRRFLYRSRWRFQTEVIEEKWEAHLADEVLRGVLLFKRPAH